MLRRISHVGAFVFLASCLEPIDLGGHGLQCQTDSDCAGQGPCYGQVCQNYPGGVDLQPQGPLRAAFFYAWYPYNWRLPPRDQPSWGEYNTADPTVIRYQLNAFEYAHVQLVLSDWYGIQNATTALSENAATPSLLDTTLDAGSPVRWALRYERDQNDSTSTGQQLDEDVMRADLQAIADQYSLHPAYYRVDGHFAVFVDVDSEETCDQAARWVEAAAEVVSSIPPLVVLQSFPGSNNCAEWPDGGTYNVFAGKAQYFGTNFAGSTFGIGPGLTWPDGGERIARDPATWETYVAEMASSDAGLQLILSYNDWNDGTEVESSSSWPSDSGFGYYLDVLHQYP